MRIDKVRFREAASSLLIDGLTIGLGIAMLYAGVKVGAGKAIMSAVHAIGSAPAPQTDASPDPLVVCTSPKTGYTFALMEETLLQETGKMRANGKSGMEPSDLMKIYLTKFRCIL